MKSMLLPLLLYAAAVAVADLNFSYNGFRSSKLALDEAAVVTADGLLQLTNFSAQQKGHAFYPDPIRFKEIPNGPVSSFTNTFVFGIIPEPPTNGGQGIAFVISDSKNLSYAMPSQFLGVFNATNSSSNILAVELDTILNTELHDVSKNHVGIAINSLVSESSHPAGYYQDPGGNFINLTLTSGNAMRLWIDYLGDVGRLDVTLSPEKLAKPKTPFLSLKGYNLSRILQDTMYVGFSASTGTNPAAHYILGWSFKIGNGDAGLLSKLPKLPRVGPKKRPKLLTIGLPVVLVVLVVALLVGLVYRIIRWRIFSSEVHEPWEPDYGPHRLKYKDLYDATKGFSNTQMLGRGGSGKVFGGVLTASQQRIAVKVVNQNSNHDLKQFVSEIVTMSGLSHRNLVKLHGYCWRKGELLIVYEFMANKSLERFLHEKAQITLDWRQRFNVIKDVATGLAYLHDGPDKVVIHRDIKPSNVLLDEQLRAKIGDFGLARLHEPGAEMLPSLLMGTIGYMAPEYCRTGVATTSTDVFAFGALLLEVACGKPVHITNGIATFSLVEWVSDLWSKGEILQAGDPKLGPDFVTEELELVLKLGSLCQSQQSCCRPSMKQIVQWLDGKEVPFYPQPQVVPKIDPTSDYPFAELFTSSPAASVLSDGR